MADWSTLMAFAVFVCVMSGTPGPGNLTFMALGAKLALARWFALCAEPYWVLRCWGFASLWAWVPC